MYTVYYNGSLIYDPSKGDPDYLLIDPKYSGELGKVDSFDFTILPGHPFYDTFDRLQTGIMAYRDGVPIFRGRVLSTSVDLEGEKSVQCEGDLAYLLDSLQPKLKYDAISCESLFRLVIANHNALVEPAKQFTVGEISALAKADIIDVSESSFNDSRSVLDSHILKSKGGYLRTRYSNGVTYIDWVEDYGRNPNQVIHLGVNLVSYEEEISADDFYTVYFPTGTYAVGDDEEPAEEGQERDRTMTIESVNHGSKYIELTDLVEKYGKIYKAESYDGPDNPAELLADAMSDISIYRKRLKRTVEIGALDLHYLDPGIDMLLVGDHVRIISEAHGKDETLVVQKVDFSFTTPEDDKYSFGDGLQTLTSKNTASNSATAAAAAKATGNSKENSANLKLVKNKIDIEANEMNLNIKENLNITAKVLSTTFDVMNLQSTEFTYHTDEEKARFKTLKEKAEKEDYDVTNQFLMKVNPEIGQAWMQAKTAAKSQWGTINNTIGMCLDSEQGMFQWDGFRHEYEHLNDDVYDAIERMKKVGIRFNVPDTELKLFAQDEEVKSRLDGQDLVIDENTRRIGLAEITLCGDKDHPGIVSQVGQYVDGSAIISIINQTPEKYAILADKIVLSTGTSFNPLMSYLTMQDGKINLVVHADEQGNWVVNPASIVAAVNNGESSLVFNADHLDLRGLVTMTDMHAEYGTGDQMSVNDIDCDGLTAENVDAAIVTANYFYNSDEEDLNDAIKTVRIVPEGSIYKLQYNTFSNDEWQDAGNFNRATTLSRSWSGGEITVTASPQGNTLRCAIFDVVSGDITWNGNVASFPLYANLDGNETKYPTGKTLRIDATARYNAGVNDVRLYIDRTNHTISASTSGLLKSGTISADGIVGEYDHKEGGYPITVRAKFNDVVMDTSKVWVVTEPDEGYQEGYEAGYSAGLAAARIKLNTSRGTISIGTGGDRTEVGVTVSGIVGNWNSTAYRCPVTIKAVVDGVTMATGTVYVYNPNG